MSKAPKERCGYTWPKYHDVDDEPNHQSCCWRDTFQNSDQCIWHADPNEVGEKPVEALRKSLDHTVFRDQSPPSDELLDGAVLTGIELENIFSSDGYYLRYADLSEADLSQVDSLSGACLSNANFSKADLTGANLQGTDLTDAYLVDADLTDANLQDADLTHASLRNADLTDADLGEAVLSYATLLYANLTHAILGETDFTEAALVGADLTDAYLLGADFTNANLIEVDLTDAYVRGANLTDADLRDVNLTDAFLRGANFTNANLRNANLTNTDFTGICLRWASLADATAIRTNFADADLLGANLEGASLKDSQFDGANLTGTRLYDTKPQGVSINDQTTFSDQNIYEREADLCDPWHPLDGEPTIPTSLPDKFALAVRSGQVLQSRFRSADASPPSGSIAKVRQAITRFRRHRNLDTEDRREVGDRLKKATSVYRIRQRLQRENSRPRDVAQPYVREQHSRRKRAFVTRSYWEWFKYSTYRWVMLYGESPARVVGTSIAVVAVFATIYSIVGGIVIGGEEPDLIGNIYFSAVTFSTLGYGGIEPTTTTTQLLASVQSLIGGILIALLVAVFGRRALR